MAGAPHFTATLFKYPGKGGWHFVTVPPEHCPPEVGDWGRTPASATFDGQAHPTSVWRGKDGRTLLPVPRALRRGKSVGDTIAVTLSYAGILRP